MLLVDEGDSLLTQRTSVQSSNDRYANLETNYLLQRLECFEGILIVTTNAGDRIDAAFERRMDVVVEFQQPQAAERWEIWQMHLPPAHAVDPDFLNDVATRCVLSGGQIRNAVLHASLLALDARGVVDAAMLDAAVRREYRKVGAVCPLRAQACSLIGRLVIPCLPIASCRPRLSTAGRRRRRHRRRGRPFPCACRRPGSAGSVRNSSSARVRHAGVPRRQVRPAAVTLATAPEGKNDDRHGLDALDARGGLASESRRVRVAANNPDFQTATGQIRVEAVATADTSACQPRSGPRSRNPLGWTRHSRRTRAPRSSTPSRWGRSAPNSGRPARDSRRRSSKGAQGTRRAKPSRERGRRQEAGEERCPENRIREEVLRRSGRQSRAR